MWAQGDRDPGRENRLPERKLLTPRGKGHSHKRWASARASEVLVMDINQGSHEFLTGYNPNLPVPTYQVEESPSWASELPRNTLTGIPQKPGNVLLSWKVTSHGKTPEISYENMWKENGNAPHTPACWEGFHFTIPFHQTPPQFHHFPVFTSLPTSGHAGARVFLLTEQGSGCHPLDSWLQVPLNRLGNSALSGCFMLQ